MARRFPDRSAAGQMLADQMAVYRGEPDTLVLALPRGGVPVAYEVAKALHAPLDVFLVRKLGVPGHPELGMGAIASGGVRVLNQDVIRSVGVPPDAIERVAERESAELRRREQAYRGERAPLDVRNRTVILVDDGLATGATMRAAAQGIQRLGPKRVIVAVPVAAASTCAELAQDVDDVICAWTPEPFLAVGMWYEQFEQTSDAEVRDLLERAEREHASADAPRAGERPVRVPADDVLLDGDLTIPSSASGIVLFAHGSGSSRKSTRNRFVAGKLQDAGLATLLFDLLTQEEEALDLHTRHLRFDIPLLARRLIAAADWLAAQEDARELPIGTFGASTGAAAALIAAADRPALVRAVVSRGGRPDLAGDALPRVRAPTLLIVGARDSAVIPLNETALARIPAEKDIVLVPNATHLFEEPGTLERVSELATAWFRKHLNR